MIRWIIGLFHRKALPAPCHTIVHPKPMYGLARDFKRFRS